jgi:hypothetical protein
MRYLIGILGLGAILVGFYFIFGQVQPSAWITTVIDQTERGDAEAQYNLGVKYAEGKGVPQDYKKAFEWYTKAAEQGDIMAQFYLGVMYEKGLGVPQNHEEAIEWWRKAAAAGVVNAKNKLRKLNIKA